MSEQKVGHPTQRWGLASHRPHLPNGTSFLKPHLADAALENHDQLGSKCLLPLLNCPLALFCPIRHGTMEWCSRTLDPLYSWTKISFSHHCLCHCLPSLDLLEASKQNSRQSSDSVKKFKFWIRVKILNCHIWVMQQCWAHWKKMWLAM